MISGEEVLADINRGNNRQSELGGSRGFPEGAKRGSQSVSYRTQDQPYNNYQNVLTAGDSQRVLKATDLV